MYVRESRIGPIPRELGKLQHLQILRLAVSKLEGPIPDTFGDLTGENLSANQFAV